MDPLTHIAAGVGLSRLIPAPHPRWAALAGLGFALLPDVDFLLIFLDRIKYLQHHRGFTHSLVALPLFALLGGLLAWRLGGRRWWRPMFLLGLLVLASHLLLDGATSYGTQLLNPFSRQKFTLDLLFIIDPYLTLLLIPGALGAVLLPKRPQVAVLSLLMAGGYLTLCAWHQHQALALARQLGGPQAVKAAALPQPFSCRRWHLVAETPAGLREAFVELSWQPAVNRRGLGRLREVTALLASEPRTPEVPFGPPQDLVVVNWPRLDLGVEPIAEAASLRERFLEFARFPHVARVIRLPGLVEATWVDLRFSLPGNGFPFALTLTMEEDGRLVAGDWGGGRRGLYSRPKTASLENKPSLAVLEGQKRQNETPGSCMVK